VADFERWSGSIASGQDFTETVIQVYGARKTPILARLFRLVSQPDWVICRRELVIRDNEARLSVVTVSYQRSNFFL